MTGLHPSYMSAAIVISSRSKRCQSCWADSPFLNSHWTFSSNASFDRIDEVELEGAGGTRREKVEAVGERERRRLVFCALRW